MILEEWEHYDKRVLREFIQAVRDADLVFEHDGATGTKNWVRNYLIPAVDAKGLAIVRIPNKRAEKDK